MSPLAIGTLGTEALLPTTPQGIDEQHRQGHKSPLEIAREFEALLVAQVIGAMRKTVASTGLFGGRRGAAERRDRAVVPVIGPRGPPEAPDARGGELGALLPRVARAVRDPGRR